MITANQPLWFSIAKIGYIDCCEIHARHYFAVLYEAGPVDDPSYDMLYKMSLS